MRCPHLENVLDYVRIGGILELCDTTCVLQMCPLFTGKENVTQEVLTCTTFFFVRVRWWRHTVMQASRKFAHDRTEAAVAEATALT